jgi:hypothetical protein
MAVQSGFAGLDPNRQYRQGSGGQLLYLRADGKWVPTTLERERTRIGVGAPAGGGEPPPSAPPPDPSYDLQMANLQRQRDEQLAGLGQQRTQQLLGYGYQEGPGGALAFDPNNPYSRAAQLKLNYDTQRRGGAQTMASRGQLYSGAYQSAQDVVNRGQLQAEDTLQKSLENWLAQNARARGTAQTSYETGAIQAGADHMARIQGNY